MVARKSKKEQESKGAFNPFSVPKIEVLEDTGFVIKPVRIFAETAKALLGWTPEPPKDATGKKVVDFGNEFAIKHDGIKVRFANNPTNRPWRKGISERYAYEIRNGNWYLNGDTIVFDDKNCLQQGQHRLVGLILAFGKWVSNGRKGKEPYIDVLLVSGISSKAEVIDSIDTGLTRNFGDVLFRRGHFNEVKNVMEQKKLTAMLATAARLVWLRSNYKKVSDAPHFKPIEAVEFIKQHPNLIRSLQFVYDEDTVDDSLEDSKVKGISYMVTLPYAAALHYLMATRGTPTEEYRAGNADLDFSHQDKADNFWVLFKNCVHYLSTNNLDNTHPVRVLVNKVLPKMDQGTGSARDRLVISIVKAFLLFDADEEAKSVKDIEPRRTRDSKTKEWKLAEFPLLGGLDAEVPDPWQEGETAYVEEVIDDTKVCWFGKVIKCSKDGKVITLECVDDGVVNPDDPNAESTWNGMKYAVNVDQLFTEKPKSWIEPKDRIMVDIEEEDVEEVAA